MKSVKASLAVVAVFAATPALADKYFAVTPSGATEMLFADDPQKVVGKLSSACIDAQWTVVTSSTNEVVCEAPMNFGQSLMGQLLMGNSYSTPPRRFFKYNVAQVGGVSRVQATGWMELQMAFGQTRRNDFSGPEFHNSAMSFLGNAGGKFPVGTQFPNHVVMGFESDERPHEKHTALHVTKVEAGMPADRAGIQVGDMVTRIARKRFKSGDDYLDAIAKAAETPAYEVEIVRAGKSMKLTLARAFRPAWAEEVVAVVPPVSQPITVPAAPLSVADELAKLAKLKTDGVITEAEFEAHKKKLLGL